MYSLYLTGMSQILNFETLNHFQNFILILELYYNFVFVIPLQKSGSITYNGHEQSEFCVQRASAYTGQTDNHIAELTVRETFDFANRCQGSSDAGMCMMY